MVQERATTPIHARGKRLVLLSYGMTSTAFNDLNATGLKRLDATIAWCLE